MRYLRVRNWEKYQYRSDKRLPWIRTYDSQLEDYDYTRLSDSTRGVLHDLRLLANRMGNKLPADPVWLARATRSHQATIARPLATLTRLGFLEPWRKETKIPANEEVVSAQSAPGERTDVALDLDVEGDKKEPVNEGEKVGAGANSNGHVSHETEPKFKVPELRAMP